jgi:hypothetical protein
LAEPQGRVDRVLLERLLETMQKVSSPIEPGSLGLLTEEHFRQQLGSQNFRYRCVLGTNDWGVPYVVECAFALPEKSREWIQGVHLGLNWTALLDDWIKFYSYKGRNGEELRGLKQLLGSCRITQFEPVCLALHLICPRRHSTCREKTVFTCVIHDAVQEAILDVTQEWAANGLEGMSRLCDSGLGQPDQDL